MLRLSRLPVAVALHKTAYSLDEVRSALTQHRGASYFKTDDGTELYKRLGHDGEEVDALLERLAVRLGRDHAVAREFTAADGAFLKIYRVVGGLRHEPETDDSPSAEREVPFEEESAAKIGLNRERFDRARVGVVEAANKVAGARLADD